MPGIFDPANAQMVHDGRVAGGLISANAHTPPAANANANFGQFLVCRQSGIHDPEFAARTWNAGQ